MWKLLLFIGLPLPGLAQSAALAWGGGVGVGNGLEAHIGAQRQGWLGLGRTRYRWWGPSSGPGSGWLDDRNTSSRQLEMAALVGYGLPIKRTLLYGGLGIGYLNGRHLGDYRYAVTQSGLGSETYYFAYRNYQALGVPLELGLLAGPHRGVRLGLSLQADFNPEKTLYCGLLTLWLGKFGQGASK